MNNALLIQLAASAVAVGLMIGLEVNAVSPRVVLNDSLERWSPRRGDTDKGLARDVLRAD